VHPFKFQDSQASTRFPISRIEIAGDGKFSTYVHRGLYAFGAVHLEITMELMLYVEGSISLANPANVEIATKNEFRLKNLHINVGTQTV
jgi:hypothetical protein